MKYKEHPKPGEKEEETKKIFFYNYNTLANACQKLKEEVVKIYAPPFFFICACLNKIVISIKRELECGRTMKGLSIYQPIPSKDIVYLALHSPLTIYTAYDACQLMLSFSISKEEIIKYAFLTGGNVENMRRMLVQRAEEEYGNLCT
jgi:hypothetical protein